MRAGAGSKNCPAARFSLIKAGGRLFFIGGPGSRAKLPIDFSLK